VAENCGNDGQRFHAARICQLSHPKKPTSKERAAVLLKAAFEALHDAGGSLPLRDVKAQVAKSVELLPSDLAVYEKTGYVRWESLLHFYSIDCVKAGFLLKQGGRWHLTPEGEAVRHLAGKDILERATKAYREWRAARPPIDDEAGQATTTAIAPIEGAETAERSLVLERAEGEARAEIEDYVRRLGPYDFQDLVAALLRAMGYSTPFIAPTGPDGGTDILAYPDPIGAKTPHIRVQVKHRPSQRATREEVAALRGVIRQDREIGLFVSSSGFTSDAIREARHGGVHIELMNLEGLLDRWLNFYERLSEDDKGHLRLRRVFFLAPE
jgi:restriction system protein